MAKSAPATFTVQADPASPAVASAVTAAVLNLPVEFAPTGPVQAHGVGTLHGKCVALNGDAAIAMALAEGSYLAPVSVAAATQWVLWTSSAAGALEPAMAALNEYLTHHTYVVGYSLSVVDVVVGTIVAAALTDGAVKLGTVPAVQRWYALLADVLPWHTVQNSLGRAKRAAAAAASGKGAKGSKAAAGAAAAGAAAAGNTKSGKGGKGDQSQPSLPALPEAVDGAVMTRFPPEASGYLHVGHVKAVLVNNYYARRYKGKLLVRFDDTNPSKEKAEYEESIIEDLAALGVKPDMVSHTSDFFEDIIGWARYMLRSGKAYMDDTPVETMREQRMEGIASARKTAPIDDNLEKFELMLHGDEQGRPWCMRANMDMSNPNKCCRDPVMFRRNETPHARTGDKYKAYPTYDFACPIVDSVEGVTHAMRTTEYKDRDEQYRWIQAALGLRPVHVVEFARMNFTFTVMSKRKLAALVDAGHVEGWNDPRFPTVKGVLRRGVTVEGLRTFILSQGASKRVVDMEWDKFWAVNKKVLEPTAHRYTALQNPAPVALSGAGCPAGVEGRSVQLHPKNPALGNKVTQFSPNILVEAEDLGACADGEEVTLMKWGNAFMQRISRGEGSAATGAEAELNLDGDFKKTEKKVTWLAATDDLTPVKLIEYDVLVTVPRMEDGMDVNAVLNPCSRAETAGVAEAALRNVPVGAVVQLERRGFYRIDKAYDPAQPSQPMELILVPDGKTKSMSKLSAQITSLDGSKRAERAAAAKAKRLQASGQ